MTQNQQIAKPNPDEQEVHRRQLGAFISGMSLLGSPELLSTMASAEGLGNYFLFRLNAEGKSVPEALQADVRDQVILTMLQERVMLEVSGLLSDAGIRPIWIKGAALAHTVYPEPRLRPKVDLDLIVEKSAFPDALDVLLGSGYRRPDKAFKWDGEKLIHHEGLLHPTYSVVYIELHHRLLGHGGVDDIPGEVLQSWLANTLQFDVNGHSLHTLQPEAHLLYLCAHAFLQHGEATLILRQLLDVHLLITQYTLNWHFILAEAVALKWTYLTEKALQRTQQYFTTPIPDYVFDELKTLRSEEEDILRVMLKSSGDIRGEAVLQLMDKMSWMDRLKMIVQIAFPSEEHMRQRYDVRDGRSTFPYYLYRWLYQAGGVLRAIVRRIRYAIMGE